MPDWAVALTGLVIAVGLVGVVLPVLPGLLLVVAGVAVWAVVEGGRTSYVLLAAALAVAAAAQVLKYGIVGFFVIPVLGLLVGFVAGVYVAERHRLRDPTAARGSTGQALRAAGVSILVELAAALSIAAGWVAVLLVS